jgi:hypothetical protein
MRGNIWANFGGCYFSDAYRVAINIALDSDLVRHGPVAARNSRHPANYVYENTEPSRLVMYPDGRVFDKEPIHAPAGMRGKLGMYVAGFDGKYKLKGQETF